MPRKANAPSRAQASARGDAIATVLFGAALIVASLIVALAETDVPKHVVGFAVFIGGVALVAWGGLELDRLAAARPKAEPKSGGRDAA